MFFEIESTEWILLKDWLQNQTENISPSDILKKMDEFKFEVKMSAQNLTSYCQNCRINIRSCDCEHKKQYFEWIGRKAREYKDHMKNNMEER